MIQAIQHKNTNKTKNGITNKNMDDHKQYTYMVHRWSVDDQNTASAGDVSKNIEFLWF